MKIVKITKGGNYKMMIGSKDTFINMQEGVGYVLNDSNASAFVEANSISRQIESIPFEKIYRKYNGEDLNDKHLVAYRTGGAGDILFMSPAIKFLKIKYPTCKISLCTSKAYEDLVIDNPYIDNYYPIPTEAKLFEEADYHILFEGVIEDESALSEEYNAYDLFLIHMGILPQVQEYVNDGRADDDFLLPTVKVVEEKLEYMEDLFEDYSIDPEEDIVVGFNPWSTTLLRNYPPNHSVELVKTMANMGIKVILLGGRGESDKADFLRNSVEDKSKRRNVVNAAPQCYDFGYTVAAVSLLDVLIGVDSACVHLAGGLQIPLIGLYGPFHSRLRIPYYKNAIGFDAQLRCAPCCIHGPYPCRFNMRGYSPCLELVEPRMVIEQLDRLLKTTQNISILGGNNEDSK